MARVSVIQENEHPELADTIAKIKGARGGRLINIYRLMLHSPALANAWFDLNRPGIRSEGRVDTGSSHGGEKLATVEIIQ
jgi:hypothetical protein